MKRQYGSISLIVLLASLGLCLASGTTSADIIAWDMVSSTSQNLVSYSTDAPVFSANGDGFQKYTVGVTPDIPWALIDESGGTYPGDLAGIIDTATDFNEFFGVTDTVNPDNSSPLHATWVFNIGSAVDNVSLNIDLAAMGDFEASDSFEWSYQVDSGPVTTILTAVADEAGSLTYTLVNGTTVDLDDPLVVNGTTLTNQLQTFSTPITTGSQLTVVLTALTDGGTEGYVARNIRVTDFVPGQAGGEPIPTLSLTGVSALVLLLMTCGVFLIRRLH